MRRLFLNRRIRRGAGIAAAFCMTLGMAGLTAVSVSAEEVSEEYFETDLNTENASLPADVFFQEDGEEDGEAEAAAGEAAALTGTYTVESGWSVDNAASTQERTVYKQDAYVGVEGTSTITCSYLDTNYSVFEYEQLRDMLTNNLLYNNVNAQISTSAVYTDAKDYLYILIVDDTAQDYRNIYCYVVGDYRCFCVDVKEYRWDAEELQAQSLKTPQEVGQGVAEKFVWN